jgi:hypothetical protein
MGYFEKYNPAEQRLMIFICRRPCHAIAISDGRSATSEIIYTLRPQRLCGEPKKVLKKKLKFFLKKADIYHTRVSGDTLSHLLLLTSDSGAVHLFEPPQFFALHKNG